MTYTVTMTGDTYAIRDRLKANGYVWVSSEKAWRKPDSQCATAADVYAWLRKVMGGKGCGSLQVEVAPNA